MTPFENLSEKGKKRRLRWQKKKRKSLQKFETFKRFENNFSRELLDMVGGDLPDGAYFAMAQEFGLEAEDFMEE